METCQSRMMIGGALALVAFACERGPELEPAAGAPQPRSMEEAVMANENGVRVVAQVRAWPGPAEVSEAVTPIRMVIENGSRTPVQVRYSNFWVTAPDGATYRAIPPSRIEAAVPTEDIRPRFTYNNFYVAPYYGSYYSGIPPYTGTFLMDAPYYDAYYPYWQAHTLLPTPEMLALALPEGVLNPGGRLDGYLYFQEVQQEDGTGVDLHVVLNPAESRDVFVSARLPFVVD